ncbi:MAG: type 1 glutamine amidotransferase [Gaiellaceae bacterium]
MRVLSIVHDPSSLGGGGLFEEIAARRGERLDRWIVPEDDHPKLGPDAYDAIMVFGGVQHPDQDDEYRWIPREVGYIAEALAAGVPTIGVCLGSQLIARAAGAWVGPAQHAEVGWHPIQLTEAANDDPVLGGLPASVRAFQWHYYTYELPEGAVQLAASPACRQAFRVGETTWGIQFHAEVTRQMLDYWLVEGEKELQTPLAEVRRETDTHLGAWNEHGRSICNAFLDVAAAT